MKKMDNFKKTEGILYNYNILEAEINILKLEIEAEQNEYEEYKSMVYGEKTGATNKINNVVENEVIHKEKIIRELTNLRNNKIKLKNKIDIALKTLTDTERELIELRYLNKNTMYWSQVADRLGVTEAYCKVNMRIDIINKLTPLIYLRDVRELN